MIFRSPKITENTYRMPAKQKIAAPKASVAEKRSEKRLGLIAQKLAELAEKDDVEAFIEEAIERSVPLTHSAKLHDARVLGHEDGLYVRRRINDGYVHSLSVSANEEIAGDVDFDVAGNAAYAKVYAVAAEVMRSPKIRESIEDARQLEILDFIQLTTAKKLALIEAAGIRDSIPGMLPTTARYNGDETRTFTIMQSPLMLMRYGNARKLHADGAPLPVRKAEVKYGSTGASTQNTTNLPNGSRAFAIVHSTSKRRTSPEDALLYAATKRGLVASLESIHADLGGDVLKLLHGFMQQAGEQKPGVQGLISQNLVRAVAQRLIAAIHGLVDKASAHALDRALNAFMQPGNKITVDECALLEFVAGGRGDQKRIEACANRITAKLLLLSRLKDRSGTFNPNQHQFAILSGAIVDAAKEIRA